MFDKFNNKILKLCTFYLLLIIIVLMVKKNTFVFMFTFSGLQSIYTLIFSMILIFSIFRIFNSFEIKTSNFFNRFSSSLKKILLSTFLFSLLSKLLVYTGLYFRSFIDFLIIVVGLFSITSLLIFIIAANMLIWKNVIHKIIPNVLISIFLIIFTAIYSLSLPLGILFLVPEEITTTYNNEKYIIKVDGFLVARDESTFTYYKSKYFFLMESLSENDIPSGILAENNDYY